MTSKLTTLMLAAALVAPLALAGGANAGAPGHLYCLSNTDREVPNLRATADLFPLQSPPFENQNCKVRLRSGNHCVPAEKENVRTRDGAPIATLDVPEPSGQPYLCYLLRCPPEGPKGKGFELEVEDQLGRRTIQIKRADYLCAPATHELPG